MKLELPVDLIVSRLQLVIMKKYKKQLDRFGVDMNTKFKDDLEKVDKYMGLPLLLMHDSIKLALLEVLNGEQVFVFKDWDV
jgi:hypothetical protein